MAYKVVVHRPQDDVGVAVSDLEPGEQLEAYVLENGRKIPVRVVEPIPLGHKIALRDIPEGKEVIEYGEKIGRATTAIPAGAHVHVHNLRSLRWSA
jgi:(2R)-sulfolactate sulfo-lyase subunit alpha